MEKLKTHSHRGRNEVQCKFVEKPFQFCVFLFERRPLLVLLERLVELVAGGFLRDKPDDARLLCGSKVPSCE